MIKTCADLVLKIKPENPDPRFPSQLENIFDNWGEITLKKELALKVRHVYIYAMINNKVNDKERKLYVCRGDEEFLQLISSENERQSLVMAGVTNHHGYYDVEKLLQMDPRKVFRVDFWRGACERFLADECWTQLCDYQIEYKPKGLKVCALGE